MSRTRKYHGRLFAIYYGDSIVAANKLAKERESTLTIECGYLQGAGSAAYTTANHASVQEWSIEGQMLMDATEFQTLFDLIVANSTASFAWGNTGDYTTLSLTGEGIITKISFAGQGNSLVRVNLDIQGTGAPTFTTAQSDYFTVGHSAADGDDVLS